MKLKAPFPYFGGKSSVADVVWKRLGNPRMYVEPFFGSGAVLLARPGDDFDHEIINDYDGHIANVWRAIKLDPDEVAKWCDWPCNHIDLMARKRVLNRDYAGLRKNLLDDPEYFNAKLAGYWVWCASNWIGSGLTCPKQRPHLAGNVGIMTAKECKRPHLTSDNGIMTGGVYEWLRALQKRLKKVKVVCCDWSQVMGGNWRTADGICGVFLDPPYGEKANREKDIYGEDSLSVAGDVLQWCKENGDNRSYRIALCGYDGEHNELEEMGWNVESWKAQGGYANKGSGKSQGKENRHRERIWFSPFCNRELTLF